MRRSTPHSEAKVDPEVLVRVGPSVAFGEGIEPCRLVRGGGPLEHRSIGGQAVKGWVADVAELGVDGTQAGVGELVLDVPLQAAPKFGAEFLIGRVRNFV